MAEVFTEPPESGGSWDSLSITYRPVSPRDAQKDVLPFSFLQIEKTIGDWNQRESRQLHFPPYASL